MLVVLVPFVVVEKPLLLQDDEFLVIEKQKQHEAEAKILPMLHVHY